MNHEARPLPRASAAKRGIGILLALSFLAVPVLADRANSYSTRAQKEIDLMLSADALAGIRVYLTTASLPTCASLRGKGAPFAYDAQAAVVKVCNGTTWEAVGGGTALTGITSITFANGGSVRTGTTSGDTVLFQAYDNDTGPGYVTFGTLTAGNTPTFTLGVVGIPTGPLTIGTTTTAGTATLIFDSAIGGAGATDNILNITGTFPASLSAATYAVNYQITGGSASAQTANALNINYLAGYTGSAFNAAASFTNANEGTGNSELGAGATYGSYSLASGVGTNWRIGAMGHTNGATTGLGIGVLGYASAGTSKIGVVGRVATGGTNSIGVLAQYDDSALISNVGKVALVVSNGAQATDIFRWYDDTTMKGRAKDGGNLEIVNNQLTAGTAAVENAGIVNAGMSSYTWTNAQVVTALAGAGDILMATLPAKTVVKNAYVVITGQAATSTTLTVACGRTSATYIDYIVASDAKAAANTVYGDASAERGTNLTGYDLPSYTGTTAVNCHFVKTGSDPTASTGRLILETALVP